MATDYNYQRCGAPQQSVPQTQNNDQYLSELEILNGQSNQELHDWGNFVSVDDNDVDIATKTANKPPETSQKTAPTVQEVQRDVRKYVLPLVGWVLIGIVGYSVYRNECK